MENIYRPSLARLLALCAKIFPEVFQRTLHREGRHATQPAQGTLHHRVAQLLEEPHIALPVLAGEDAVDDLDPARRADPAGGALAAGLDRAELHCIARHPRHVYRIVEYHDTAMPQKGPHPGERLVVHRGVEVSRRDIGPERSADLDRADAPPRSGAGAVVIKELAQREAEGALHEA